MKYMRMRADDMLKQADMMKQSIAMIEKMYELTKQLTATIHDMVGKNTRNDRDRWMR